MRKYNYLLILLSLHFFSCNNNETKTNTERSWGSIDTVLLPIINPIRVNSYYNNENGSSYLSFIDVNNMNIYLIINDNNNNKIEQIFNYKKAFNHYKKENHNLYYFFKDTNYVYILLKNPIQQGIVKQSMVQIDNDGQFKVLEIQNNSNKIYYIQSPNNAFSFLNKNIFIATYFSRPNDKEPPLNDYQFNTKSRLKAFSQPPALLFEINDSTSKIIKEYGTYPKVLLDTTKFIYNYFPNYTIYNNTAAVFLYRDFDTLYLERNDKTIKYAFKSKNKHNNSEFDMEKLYNYNYIQQHSCETSNPMYLKYNSKRKLLYLIYAKYQKFENDDGTINKAVNNPFSIIVFDSLFQNIGEFDISNEYSKFNSFTTAKGIALKNVKLSKNNNNATYVVFNVIEK